MQDSELADEARRTLNAWEAARQESDAVQKQFIAWGPMEHSREIQMPPRVLDAQGMEELKAADEKEKAAWDAHQKAIGGLRKRRR